jgi:non-structural maintenance of chromosomes element 1
MSDNEDDGGGGGGSYDNTHRAFLQAMLAHQTITFEKAKPLLAAIQTADTPDRPTTVGDISQEDFENYIDALNAAISPFDLEIRHIPHQTTKQVVYALVNTTSDALTQMATIHTADEIAFVKRVLDAMFDTYNTPRAEIMAVTSMQALKLAKGDRRESGATQGQSQNAGLTMSQAEKVLGSMVEEGWFELSTRGYYTLTPRALMELRGWLQDTYNDLPADEDEEEEDDAHQKIKFCQACKEIVTMGQRCPNLECAARLHTPCVRNMFRAQGGNEVCPMCKRAWVDAPPVGEKAANRNRPSTNGASARRTSAMNMDGAADESTDVEAGAST